jgi:hypothetical protein
MTNCPVSLCAAKTAKRSILINSAEMDALFSAVLQQGEAGIDIANDEQQRVGFQTTCRGGCRDSRENQAPPPDYEKFPNWSRS